MENMFGDLMNQAKKMQEQMEKAQKELQDAEYQGESGAGMVSVVMTGRHDVKKVNIDESLLKEDKSLLEDLIGAAVNDAVRKIEQGNKDKLSGFASGIDLPEGFKMPF
jgi:DNA-binding YbaB/EbfC family protein